MRCRPRLATFVGMDNTPTASTTERLVLSRNDPRYPKPTHRRRGELNCDRYCVIEERIFRVYRECGSWQVEELETEHSMVTFDECVAVALTNLNEARAAIVRYVAEWPTESREEHYQRLRAWTRARYTEVAR